MSGQPFKFIIFGGKDLMKKKKILAISALLSMLCIFCFKNYAYARWTGDWESVNIFYFTLKVGVGTDSYVMDTWCFDDKTLESVSNANNLSSNCDAAMCIIRDAWWKPDHGGYSESGAITWSGSGLNWNASGDYEHDTPFIRIQIVPPAGYHLARVQDADGSNMKYSQSGDIIIAECGAIMGDWVSADKIPLSSYRQNGGTSNISLIWEKDEVPSYNVDVNCYYWDNSSSKWVNETSNFSYVKVNHDNSNNWNTDDFFGVSYGSNYTVYAKPVEGWQIVGWSDVESAKNESTSGEDLIKTPGLYTSTTSSSWTGKMDTTTAGKYGSTETISVFVKRNKYTLGFQADGGILPADGNMGTNSDCHLSDDKTNGGVPVTFNEGWYNDMSRDIPYREGYTFNGWYKPYWNDNGTLNHLEQIYNNEGRAVESSIWHWDNNTGWHYIYAGNETLWAGWTKNDYSLDLNIVYGGDKLCSTEEILPYIDGFDVYIDGNLVAENVPDYCSKFPYGSTYEFKNFRMKPGYVFTNDGSLSGTVGAKENEAVAYVYDNNALAYYDGNGATGGELGVADSGKDYFVNYATRNNYLYENGNATAMKNVFKKNNYSFINYKTENGTYRSVRENIDPTDNCNPKAVIKSAYNNDLVFNIAGNIYKDGTNICLWWNDCYNESNYWSFLPSGDGYFFIVNNYSGMFLDLVDGNAYDLANVQLCHLNWSYAQQWKLIPAGDGYYYIASRCNENYRLDAQGGSQNSNAGQNVCVYHAVNYDGQRWKIDFLNREDYFQVQWTPATRLTEYYGNGDNDNFSYFKSLQATDDNIADTNRFKRIGYTFTGYNTSADGSGKSYKESDVIDKTDCQGITLIRNHTNYDYAIKQTSSNSTLHTNYADYELNQWWSFVKAKDLNAYYIVNQSTGQALTSKNNVVKTADWNTNDSTQLWDLELMYEHEYQISIHNSNQYLTMRDDNYVYTEDKVSDTDEDYDYQIWNIDGISSALYAQWKPNPDTKYIVRHWKQKIYIDGTKQYSDAAVHNETNYFLADTDNLKGTTDTEVTPSVKSYEGFTVPDVQTVTIKPDGSLVVNYYYTRQKYKLNCKDDFDNNGEADAGKGNGIENITGDGEYYYEEEVTLEAYIKTGYHWHISDDCHTDTGKYPTGWTVTKEGCGIDKFLDNTSYGSQKIKFIMPAHNVYLKADATNNSYTISFNNNGGTGDMTPVSAIYDVPVTLPENTFTRTTEAGTSTFLYWQFNGNTYVDNTVVNNLTSDFNGNVTLTAIWDDTPVITAQDRYFTVDDSQSGKITLEELLSTAKVTDDWDADITDKLTVKNYHPENYTQFKTDGAVKIVYTVTDNSGNIAEVSVMAYIVDTTAVEEEKNTYVRFIGPDYYQESYENGGLEDNSIWRNDPEYAAVLERAMRNRLSMTYSYNEAQFFNIPIKARKAASDSRDHLVEQWVFTQDDIKAVKEYVNEHGIGNMKEPDALANFRLQFAHCKKQ